MKPPAPLPDPVELGFPAKFTGWYPDQIRAIDLATMSTKRFVALVMPTGSGKSVTGIATALLHPHVKRALYLTSTKGLQDQLKEDFTPLGLHDVRGARNYPCVAVQPGNELQHLHKGRYWIGCDEGPCRSGAFCSQAPNRKEPSIRPKCAYYQAVHDARRIELVSTNYAMWLSSGAYSEGLGKFDLLILDEAHDADKELEAFLTFEITIDDAHLVDSKMLKTTDVAPWRDWANYHRGSLAARIEQRELHPPQDIEGVRDLRAMKATLLKLERLGKVDPLAWVCDLDRMRAKLAPTNVSRYAEEFLFRETPHVLLMSATMTRKTTQLLGIKPDDLTFWECPHRFPIEHRRVIAVPSVRVDMRMSDDDKFMWMRRIDRLIEPRLELGWKGIIHTVSYQRMKELLARSEHREWMIAHDSGNTREQIQNFKRLAGPWILVSPAIVTGYDFPGDQCRYQIIGKVPLPDMRGAIMTIRKELDPEYGGYLAMQKLVQACGRPVRGPQDWAECVAPETRILTNDLRWVAAGDLSEGAELLAFDEHSSLQGVGRKHGDTTPSSGHRRKWRWSRIVKNRTSIMPRVRVILDDAELICTPNHPWLIHAHRKEQGYSRSQVWWRSDQLQPGDKLLRLLRPWSSADTYEKGWLSGFADGEGCLAVGTGERNKSVLRVFLSQNVNDVAIRASEYLGDLGFEFSTQFRRENHAVLSISGGVCETLRFLGEVRPVRLLDKFLQSPRVEDLRRVSISTVLAVEKLPDGPIASFQTSTATYLAEGFGAHNTFIVDDHFGDWFLKRFRKHAPRWFLDAVEFVDTLPDPIEIVAA